MKMEFYLIRNGLRGDFLTCGSTEDILHFPSTVMCQWHLEINLIFFRPLFLSD